VLECYNIKYFEGDIMSNIKNYLNTNEYGEEIYVEGFGKQIVRLYKIGNTTKIYIAEFTYNDQIYEAVVNDKGQALLPFSTSGIQNFFNTKNNKDYCFTLYDDTNYYRSYHFKKIDNEFKLVSTCLSTNDTLCRLLKSEKDYWVVERSKNGLTEYSLYDVEKCALISPYFSEINFEDGDDPRVLALFEKNIYYNPEENGKDILLDRIVGFIDYEGNFISPLYSEEQNEYYDSINYNHDRKFTGFNTMIDVFKYKLSKKYEEKNQRIENSIDILFNNLYSIESLKVPEQKAKIIQFDRRKK